MRVCQDLVVEIQQSDNFQDYIMGLTMLLVRNLVYSNSRLL
jgi:hypothetical protein